MKEIEIVSSEEAREKFSKLRKQIDNKVNKAENQTEAFLKELDEVYLDAIEGDSVAQDYLSYVFKKGKYNVVPENYDLSMKWQILSAANGNCFAIDKMTLFINSCLDEIVYHSRFGEIKYIHKLNKENYVHILGKYIFEGIADELDLDPKKLIKEKQTKVAYSAQLMHKFEKARDDSLKKVIDFLLTP